MMIQVNIPTKALKLLGIKEDQAHKVTVFDKFYCVLGHSSVEYIAGKSPEGQEEGIVLPGQFVQIALDRGIDAYIPVRGTFYISVNPLLYKYGQVTFNSVIGTRDLAGYSINFEAKKKVDLKEIGQLFTVMIGD